MRSWYINPVICYHWSLLILKICVFNCMIGKEGLSQAQNRGRRCYPVSGRGNMPRKPRGWEVLGIQGWPLFLVLITMSWGHLSSLYQRSDLKSKMGQQFWQVNQWNGLGPARPCCSLVKQTRELMLLHWVWIPMAMKSLVDSLPWPSFKHTVLRFAPQTSIFLPQDLGVEVVVT